MLARIDAKPSFFRIPFVLFLIGHKIGSSPVLYLLGCLNKEPRFELLWPERGFFDLEE